jgi:hypothetical protein
MAKRIKTVEYDPGWGYIARNPRTGKEVIEEFRWRTRDMARAVVAEARLVSNPDDHETR